MGYQVQVQVQAAEWAGKLTGGRWVPAYSGTYNGTSDPDAEASTFLTARAADSALEWLAEQDAEAAERRGREPARFRVVEVE